MRHTVISRPHLEPGEAHSRGHVPGAREEHERRQAERELEREEADHVAQEPNVHRALRVRRVARRLAAAERDEAEPALDGVLLGRRALSVTRSC